MSAISAVRGGAGNSAQRCGLGHAVPRGQMMLASTSAASATRPMLSTGPLLWMAFLATAGAGWMPTDSTWWLPAEPRLVQNCEAVRSRRGGPVPRSRFTVVLAAQQPADMTEGTFAKR